MSELQRTNAQNEVDAVVIGAGFSGLYMLYRLRDVLGLNVELIETAPGVGGTWYWNRYPGARCDTESYIYCYSFSRELSQEWDWSGRYPLRDELLAYLNHVADRFELRRNITFNTLVTKAAWDENRLRWIIETDGGRTVAARFLVTAIGILTAAPYVPDLPGIQEFGGEVYHTRYWPEETPEFTNKTVGVMGTGSTGAQLIPQLATQASELVVFQRTAQYMVPAQDALVDRAYLNTVKQNYDQVWEKARWGLSGMPWGNNGRSAWEDTPEQQRELWEGLWAQGGQRFLQQNYKDVLTDASVSELVSEFVREKIHARVSDPQVADALTPRSYLIGGRRTVIETGYFEAFNRSNVRLLDVAADPVERILDNGVRLMSGAEVELDVLVLATGFDAVTGPFLRVDFRGTHDATLDRLWESGPRSFLGMAMNRYPNFFMITGPGSTFGNHAVLMEHQVEWIGLAIAATIERGASRIEATEKAQDEWMEWVDKAARATIQFGTKSWFSGTNIPGKPQAAYVYLGSYRKYRRFCDNVAAEGFPGLEIV